MVHKIKDPQTHSIHNNEECNFLIFRYRKNQVFSLHLYLCPSIHFGHHFFKVFIFLGDDISFFFNLWSFKKKMNEENMLMCKLRLVSLCRILPQICLAWLTSEFLIFSKTLQMCFFENISSLNSTAKS